jgi:D-tyrosyl-tRNA(Tyr) deacylase
VTAPSRTSRVPRAGHGLRAASTRALSAPRLPEMRDNLGVVRAVVQRVSEAAVAVDGEIRGRCGPGFLVLLGVAAEDGEAQADRLAGRVARLRIFEDENGRFDRSLLDSGGEALVVSQFTLIADTSIQVSTASTWKGSKGNRPSFSLAAPPEVAAPLYERFCTALREHGVHVETGVFGARMEVSLVNDGPVTVVLDV